MEGVSVPAMLGLIEIENAKIQGLVALDADLVFHLIDLMLGGDESVAPVAITRTFTEIDMALCRLHLDALIAAFDGALASSFGRPIGKRMNVAGQRQDITQVRIAPDNVDVLVYHVTLDMGPAARSGNLRLFLPLAMLDVICADMNVRAVEVRESEPQDLWKLQMRRAAATSTVLVNAVLHRQSMAVRELMALKAGDLLSIPPGAIGDVSLEISQPGGKHAQIGSGHLGAYQGAKVVKLHAPLDPRVTAHVRRVL